MYDNHDPQIVPTKGLVDVEFTRTGMYVCVYVCIHVCMYVYKCT
jgi:hypothetical protein